MSGFGFKESALTSKSEENGDLTKQEELNAARQAKRERRDDEELISLDYKLEPDYDDGRPYNERLDEVEAFKELVGLREELREKLGDNFENLNLEEAKKVMKLVNKIDYMDQPRWSLYTKANTMVEEAFAKDKESEQRILISDYFDLEKNLQEKLGDNFENLEIEDAQRVMDIAEKIESGPVCLDRLHRISRSMVEKLKWEKEDAEKPE